MARRKSKKDPAADASPPQGALSNDRKATAVAAPASDVPCGMMRKSTCLMGMALTLVLGLYLGGLLPSLLNSATPGAQQASAPAQAPAASQAATQNTPPPIPPEMGKKIIELETALLNNPKDAAKWTALGNLYFDTGQARQAISAYERSLALAPDNANVLTDMGIMHREAGAYEQAVESFRKASAINPSHENALFNEGVVLYYDLKRKEEAEQAWQRLLKVNPGAKAPDGKAVSEMIKHLH